MTSEYIGIANSRRTLLHTLYLITTIALFHTQASNVKQQLPTPRWGSAPFCRYANAWTPGGLAFSPIGSVSPPDFENWCLFFWGTCLIRKSWSFGLNTTRLRGALKYQIHTGPQFH